MKRYLVIGAGSAGRRHARNLRSLGAKVGVMDPRADRRDQAEAEGPVVGTYDALEGALDDGPWAGAVVASPPVFHVSQIEAVCDRSAATVLSEKPLSVTASEAARLRRYGDRVVLAYTYRWWPPLVELRDRLRSGVIGKPLSLRFVMSAHLADWHPWERYQEFFMSQAKLGGGALLDESHFIDLALWLGVRPRAVTAFVDRVSELEIDTDDQVDVLIRGAGGETVNLHLDLFGRPHERRVTVVGDAGTLEYRYEDNLLVQGTGEGRASTPYACERNVMFLGAARELVDRVEGADRSPTCSVEDGIATLEVIDACRESARSHRHVHLDR